MKQTDLIQQKIFTLPDLERRVMQWRFLGKTISFTNGCFDILHQGHLYSLAEAARYADLLIVGVNSDSSVKKLKGAQRPLNDEMSRATLLAALVIVDAVVVFPEDTPLEIIKAIKPDFLVKGGDYTEDQIAGAKEVNASGGKVIIVPTKEGFSTTGLISKIKEN